MPEWVESLLVMWSGGIDSTYELAYNLLARPRLKIHAHHIRVNNFQGRAAYEKKAIQAILPKLERLAPGRFIYSESGIDLGQCQWIPYDMALVCFGAGACALNAHHASKEPTSGIAKIDAWTIGTHHKEGHYESRFKMIEPIVAGVMWPYDPPKFVLGTTPTKSAELAFLNHYGILEDCWYCRTPMNGNPCGRCHTCNEVKEATV